MSFEFRPPTRENAPLLIGLSGGSGSGKTFSACLLARGLAQGAPWAFLDTENGRALHYADYFPDMRHAHLREPFSPARYAEAIKAADAQFPVIVVDSGSHEYEGEGGVLRMQEAEFARLGGRDSVKMLSWVKPKTEHKSFVRQLLQTKAHVILCMRAEDKIEIVDDPANPGKKKAIAKPSLIGADGWIPIMEKRLPFEMTLSLLLTPDTPGVPKPIKLQEQHKPFVPLDRPLDEPVGASLAEWAAGSSAQAAAVPTVESAELVQEADALTTLLLAYGEEQGKRDLVLEAIEANRERWASKLETHVKWLNDQIERAKEAQPA